MVANIATLIISSGINWLLSNYLDIILIIFCIGLLSILTIRFPILYPILRIIFVLVFTYYFIKDAVFSPPELRWIPISTAIFIIFFLILFVMVISKKQIGSFNNFASKWFDLLKWLTIIGAISLAAEQTHDWFLNLILFISYIVICSYIAFWLLDKIGTLGGAYINSRKNREKTPEQRKKDEKDMWKYGMTDDDLSVLPIIAILLSLVAIFFLYSFVNHIVVMLTNSSSYISH